MKKKEKQAELSFAEIATLIPIAAVTFPSAAINAKLGIAQISYQFMFSIDDYIVLMLRIWPLTVATLAFYYFVPRLIKYGPYSSQPGMTITAALRRVSPSVLTFGVLAFLLCWLYYKLPITDAILLPSYAAGSIWGFMLYCRTWKADHHNEIGLMLLSCCIALAVIYVSARIKSYESIRNPQATDYVALCTSPNSCKKVQLIATTKAGFFYIESGEIVARNTTDNYELRWKLPDSLKTQ